MKGAFYWVMLTIVVLFTVSCNNPKTTSQLDDASLQSAATQLQDNLPEITDKLAICMYASVPGPSLWRDAIDNFREKYPDIEVTIEYIYPTTFLTNLKSEETGDESLKMGPEAHIQRIETEILSGHGADILLLTVHSDRMAQLFPDMNKVALSGVFLDLNPYMNGGGLIDPDDCFGNIITAASLSGQQSYLPLSFDVPIVLSTQANLNSIGFDISRAQMGIHEFEEELYQKLPEDQQWVYSPRDMRFSVANTKTIDYETKTTNFDNAEIRSLFERQKNSGLKWQRDARFFESRDNFWALSEADRAQQLIEGNPLMMIGAMYPAVIQARYAQRLTYNGVEPVIFPINNEEGGLTASICDFAAIRANSENAGTALLLLKYLLSKEVQGAHGYPTAHALPVRRDALADNLELAKTVSSLGSVSGLASLSDQFVEDMIKSLDKISDIQFQNIYLVAQKIGSVDIAHTIDEYYIDKITYEQMVEIVEPELQFYLYE